MERRDFLRIIPLAAVAPVAPIASKEVQDGVVSLELPGAGHYVIFIDRAAEVDLATFPNILPPGSTGGWIIETCGPPDELIKLYKLK